jgi:hypothetical protein
MSDDEITNFAPNMKVGDDPKHCSSDSKEDRNPVSTRHQVDYRLLQQDQSC